jgi:PAS domain-containing protein
VGGALILIAQAPLIGGLLIQRRRRRRAEDALRHSESRNSAVLRALPDLMFVLNGQGRYVDFHARDLKLLFARRTFMGGRSRRSCRKIVDSGVGFDPIAIDHGGLGLLSMRERVGILRGKLVINASPGQGTRIGVSIPVSPSSEGRTPFASV